MGGGKLDIRSLYNILNDFKVILYVGNISERKNQKQLIESFELLLSNLKYKTFILFIGNRLEINDGIDDLI